MNKKLLFGIMSLAALASCSTDDFENKTVAEGAASPVQFEVINGNGAITRASWNETEKKVEFSAKDGDLFTLFHGGFMQNATYKATSDGGVAILTTPSMIEPGNAVMVWPADTTFRTGYGTVTVKIPTELTNVENSVPYVSDQILINPYAKWDDAIAATQFNVAGKDRKYPVYMRQIASVLTVNADYAGTDATIAELYTGGAACPADGGIEPITLTSVELSSPTEQFNTELPLKFTIPTAFGPTSTSPGSLGYEILDNWAADAPNHSWQNVTELDETSPFAVKSPSLVTKCITGTESCKFLLLKQANFAGTNLNAAIIVKTLYGDVVIADPTYATTDYTATEIADAWYRYVTDPTVPGAINANETAATAAEAAGDYAGKYKVTANTATGFEQTINALSAVKATKGTAKYEPVGGATTRFVKVLLSHLDMNALHVKNDKHLRDAVLVHEKMGLPATTVQLDGDAKNHEFEISQKTIKLINDYNAAEDAKVAADPLYIPKYFNVKGCTVGQATATTDDDEYCKKIVVTGASDIATVQDLTFIINNGSWKVDVVLKKGETWKWSTSGTVQVDDNAVRQIVNKGTFVTDADARYKTAFAGTQNNVKFVNDGTWNISGATLYPEFDVTNNGTVNIASGAQLRQSGFGGTPTAFTNDAQNKPTRFGGKDNQIGKVINKGVFATVTGGSINNYGLIEHAADDAKTYITTNQTGAGFGSAFNKSSNKIGQINLTYANRNEDNISISAGAGAQGFVSVTVTTADAPSDKKLDVTTVGTWVNYVIIKSGIEEITSVTTQVKFIEFNSGNTEIAWNILPPAAPTAEYTGLMVLSPVNIKLGTTINVTGSTYLGKDMYVGGLFQYKNAGVWTKVDDGTNPAPATFWDGYFGITSGNVATMYVTY